MPLGPLKSRLQLWNSRVQWQVSCLDSSLRLRRRCWCLVSTPCHSHWHPRCQRCAPRPPQPPRPLPCAPPLSPSLQGLTLKLRRLLRRSQTRLLLLLLRPRLLQLRRRRAGAATAQARAAPAQLPHRLLHKPCCSQHQHVQTRCRPAPQLFLRLPQQAVSRAVPHSRPQLLRLLPPLWPPQPLQRARCLSSTHALRSCQRSRAHCRCRRHT